MSYPVGPSAAASGPVACWELFQPLLTLRWNTQMAGLFNWRHHLSYATDTARKGKRGNYTKIHFTLLGDWLPMDIKLKQKSINILNTDIYLATHAPSLSLTHTRTCKRLTLPQFDIYLAVRTHRLASLCRSVSSKWEMSSNTLINGTFIQRCCIQTMKWHSSLRGAVNLPCLNTFFPDSSGSRRSCPFIEGETDVRGEWCRGRWGASVQVMFVLVPPEKTQDSVWISGLLCVCVCVAAGGAYGDHYDAPDTRDCQFLFNKDSVHCVCVCVSEYHQILSEVLSHRLGFMERNCSLMSCMK